jgi:hypothetical protein
MAMQAAFCSRPVCFGTAAAAAKAIQQQQQQQQLQQQEFLRCRDVSLS